MFNFEGKVVIIIGVNSGLGFVFVKVLVWKGVEVIFVCWLEEWGVVVFKEVEVV